MGEIADMIIDGILDYETGEYIGKAVGYPRTINSKNSKSNETEAEKNIRKVRKELAILINKKKDECDKNAVNNARKEINLKYGKDWRSRGLIINSKNQWKPLSEYK